MGAHRAVRSGRAVPTAAVALLALFAGVVGAAPASATAGTYVRMGQFAPGAMGELVVLPVGDAGEGVTLAAEGYGDLTEYRRIEPGDHVVGIREDGDAGTPVVRTALDAAPGAAYTLAVVGAVEDPDVVVVTDDLSPPPPGSTRVRVFQAFSGDPVDVSGPGGVDLGRGLAVGVAGPYRALPAGRADLLIGSGADRVPVTLGAGEVVSVVLGERDGVLTAEPHVDAAGPVAPPPGPVHAGFGPAGGNRETGAAVLGALAVAAAGGAAWSGRRPRSPRRPS